MKIKIPVIKKRPRIKIGLPAPNMSRYIIPTKQGENK